MLTVHHVKIILSDCIVIWRACVVWDKSRPVVAFGAALVVTVLGLNIGNFVYLFYPPPGYRGPSGYAVKGEHGVYPTVGQEDVGIFDVTSLGFAAIFMSLVNNVCATILVGLKAW